jgi:hypothetical protein
MDAAAEAHAATGDADASATADVNTAHVAAAEVTTTATATATAASTVPRFREAAARDDSTDHERDKTVAHAVTGCIARAPNDRPAMPEERPSARLL